MPERLTGKTAIIIGAGSIGPGWGNGRATAVLFAREGAKVFCVDRDEAAAQATVDIIRDEGGDAEFCRADATVSTDIERVVADCLALHDRIDVLHNNVGIVETGGVVELTEEAWNRMLAVNLTSCFLAMKHVIPVMDRQGGGSIINTSSIAAIRYLGLPHAGYYTTKAALSHLTRTTAAEYAPKQIRVNSILPGLMKTPMVEHATGLVQSYGSGDVEAMWRARASQVPMGFMGEGWDVAYAALYLASDESKYVTGIELVVDGGITLKVD